MSCSCFQTPCCCAPPPSCGECSETIEYTAENANLVGVGMFGAQEGTLFRFRGVAGISPIVVQYNNVTKVAEISFNPAGFKVQQTFTDSAARNSATPVFLGQLGLQIDTGVLYYGTSLVAGGWTPVVV